MNFTSTKRIKKVKTQVEFSLTLCIREIGSSSWASDFSVSKTSPHGPGSQYKKEWPVGLPLHLFNPLQSQKQQSAFAPVGGRGVEARACGKDNSVLQKELGVWSQKNVIAVLVLPWSSCEIWHKSLQVCSPHYPHLWHRDSNVGLAFLVDLL